MHPQTLIQNAGRDSEVPVSATPDITSAWNQTTHPASSDSLLRGPFETRNVDQSVFELGLLSVTGVRFCRGKTLMFPK